MLFAFYRSKYLKFSEPSKRPDPEIKLSEGSVLIYIQSTLVVVLKLYISPLSVTAGTADVKSINITLPKMLKITHNPLTNIIPQRLLTNHPNISVSVLFSTVAFIYRANILVI